MIDYNDENEIPKHKKKGRRKKPWKIVLAESYCPHKGTIWSGLKKGYVLSRYETEGRAEQALRAYQTGGMLWSKLKLEIVKDKKVAGRCKSNST